MILIQQIKDPDYIRLALTDEKVWPYIHDDFSAPRGKWQPLMHPMVIWLEALLIDEETREPQSLGMFFFTPINGVTLEVHNCLFSLWGKQAYEAAKKAELWIWRNTKYMRLRGNVPGCNPLALRFTKKLMAYIGKDEQSYQKDGSLYDQFLFGLSRPMLESAPALQVVSASR